MFAENFSQIKADARLFIMPKKEEVGENRTCKHRG
jgi:hypothetical protein